MNKVLTVEAQHSGTENHEARAFLSRADAGHEAIPNRCSRDELPRAFSGPRDIVGNRGETGCVAWSHACILDWIWILDLGSFFFREWELDGKQIVDVLGRLIL